MKKILQSLLNKRILVIGDLMLDHYIWGDVNRISPEAPVPVVNVIKDSYAAGGAANVALNLANLKVNVQTMGYLCDDEAGVKLSEILKTDGIEVIKTSCLHQPPTIIKTRVIVRSQQMCRIDREANQQTYNPVNDLVNLDSLKSLLANVDAIIISDYAKGVITQDLLDNIFKIAESRPDLLIAIDPKPYRKLNFRNAGLLTPNRAEALELSGLKGNYSDEDYPLEQICKLIQEQFSPKLLVVTLGAQGMVVCKDGEIIKRLPTKAREVFDVSGAGDTVIATLTAALSAGASPEEAAELANIAAGCVVAHMGTAPIDYDELAAQLV